MESKKCLQFILPMSPTKLVVVTNSILNMPVPNHPPAKKARKSRAKKGMEDLTTNEELPEKTPKPKRVRKPRTKKQIPVVLQGNLVTPVEKPKRKSRTKKSVVNEVHPLQANQQSMMPCIHTPNDLGPPSLDPITTAQGTKRNGKFTRLEKGKGLKGNSWRPKNWVPSIIQTNDTPSVMTRAKKKLLIDFEGKAFTYEEPEGLLVPEMHMNFQEEDQELFTEIMALEPRHTVGSMDTLNLDLPDFLVADQDWHQLGPIQPTPGFFATHPGGNLVRLSHEAVYIEGDMYANYDGWNTNRAGWAVLVPNRFLSQSSFHTGDTPSWTQGDILGEGMHQITGQKMVVCSLGGFARPLHMAESNVRIACGLHERAVGSESGHGYGWQKRMHCFNQEPTFKFTDDAWDFLCEHEEDDLQNIPNTIGEDLQYTPRVAANIQVPEVQGIPIDDYEEPEDIEAPDGTQDSTARTTFPRVSYSLPEYFLGVPLSMSEEGSGEEETIVDGDSSAAEWFPDYRDMVESSDSDFDVDLVDESTYNSASGQWCMDPNAFKPTQLDEDQLSQYYRKEAWSSASVGLFGTRDNFSGPKPGFKFSKPETIPKPQDVFNLYWSDETLSQIVLESNRYANQVMPYIHSNNLIEEPHTKGGLTWIDLTKEELRGWLGCCILMGCKRLPSVRHYWMCSEDFLHCNLISSVMSLARWEQICRCLHLVNNDDVVRDSKDPRFDRIAKTRWLVQRFVKVSEAIYSLERELTIDECVVPYKGKYCFIRQFMPDKPVRFGIKCWLLASSKSRFVWRIEVYFGEGTGVDGKHGLGYSVVNRLMTGLNGRGHCLVVDNLFSSVNLFHHLMVEGTWATGTVRKTSKNLPGGLYMNGDGEVRGTMLIRTHVHRQMGVVNWKDKKLVTLLSTATAPWEPHVQVLRRMKGLHGQLIVPSSPMHKQYVEYMRGVDVTDQLRSNYSSQLKSHKWWHKIMFLCVDQSLVNGYVVHVAELEKLGLKIPTHLSYKIAVGKHLVEATIVARENQKRQPPPMDRRPNPVHSHWRSKLKRVCILCGFLQRWYCPACGYKWMCRELCYHAIHAQLEREGKA